MNPLIRRFRGPAVTCLGILGLGALATSASAMPISYNIAVGGGTLDCGRLRPMGQACGAALTGSVTVDNSMGDFASQLVSFSLQLGDHLSFTRQQLSGSGFALSSLDFDATGNLTGFDFRNFFGPFDDRNPSATGFPAYYMNISDGVGGNSFRFGDRSDPINVNGCSTCVSVTRAVPEPGIMVLFATALVGLWLSRRRREPATTRGS